MNNRLRVVLFSGGRGSQALSRSLAANPNVDLTLAVNGYDDGKSTGEVRRFLGDSLGPSDFRKNAGTLAETLGCCVPELVQLLDAWSLKLGRIGHVYAGVSAARGGSRGEDVPDNKKRKAVTENHTAEKNPNINTKKKV